MRITLIILAVITLSGLAVAQVSPEEAYAKLRERQKAAETQPGMSEVEQLRKQVASLKKDLETAKSANATLEAKVAELRTIVASAEKASDGKTSRSKSDRPKRLAAGMTLDEVKNFVSNFHPQTLESDASYTTYRFVLYNDVVDGSQDTNPYYLDCTFAHDKMVSFEKTVVVGGGRPSSGQGIGLGGIPH